MIKKILFLLFILSSFSSFSSSFFHLSHWNIPYEIIRHEAQDYVSYTHDELKTLLGENAHFISHYQCDGHKEFDVFSPPVRINSKKDSFKIHDKKNGFSLIYRKGKLFPDINNPVRKNISVKQILRKSSFIKKVFATLLQLEELNSTKKILRFLEASHFPVSVVEGLNSFNATPDVRRKRWGIQMSRAIVIFSEGRMSPHLPFYDIGVGGELNWSPDLKVKSLEEDGKLRKVSSKVALAHELYHAFDSVRGLLDHGFIFSDDFEMTQIQEYRGVYFENLVRKELGLKLRKSYHKTISPENPHRDLLDDKGHPIFVPSPCIK